MKQLEYQGKKILYKIKRKKIKNLYLRVKEGFVEISCSDAFSDEFIKNFILQKAPKFIESLQPKEYYYFFGQKIKGEIDKSIYKEILPTVIFPLIQKYANAMNLYPQKISFRFNSTRWGSCSSKDTITFNNYLAKLPIELIEYVVAHELAHIKYKDHSSKFWAFLAQFMPDYKERRKKLREFERFL